MFPIEQSQHRSSLERLETGRTSVQAVRRLPGEILRFEHGFHFGSTLSNSKGIFKTGFFLRIRPWKARGSFNGISDTTIKPAKFVSKGSRAWPEQRRESIVDSRNLLSLALPQVNYKSHDSPARKFLFCSESR
jgi:hypothetical protein